MARKRHPFGAASRDTHHTSPVDFAHPSDRLYGSEMDLEPVTVTDIGAGSITDGAIVEGGLDGTIVIKDGTLPPSPPPPEDSTPCDPPQWDTVPLLAGTRLAEDGTVQSFITVNWLPLPAVEPNLDLSHYEVWVRPTVTGAPGGWDVSQGALASGTFAVGSYFVTVTAQGVDGGETVGSRQVVEVTEATCGIVVSGLAGALRPGMTTPFKVYVSVAPDSTDLRLAATTSAATVAIGASPTGPPESAYVPSSTAVWSAYDLFAQTVTDDYTHVVYEALRAFKVAVRSVDKAGNRSLVAEGDWRFVTSPRDEDAPPVPEGVAASDGNKLIGVRWNPVTAADLSHYQVRWLFAEDVDDVTPGVYPTDYQYAETRSTLIVLSVPGYGKVKGNVRAIDLSGNVFGGLATDEPQVGWSEEWVEATSSKLLPTDLHLSLLTAELVDVIKIDADQIVSGEITVAPGGEFPGAIIIKEGAGEDAPVVGRWDMDGWFIIDPANPTHAIRARDGAIYFTHDGDPDSPDPRTWADELWTSVISADGMSADFITTGSHIGGHNRVLNSGFELTPQQIIQASTYISDTAAEWDGATLQSSTNKATGQNVLAMYDWGAP